MEYREAIKTFTFLVMVGAVIYAIVADPSWVREVLAGVFFAWLIHMSIRYADRHRG